MFEGSFVVSLDEDSFVAGGLDASSIQVEQLAVAAVGIRMRGRLYSCVRLLTAGSPLEDGTHGGVVAQGLAVVDKVLFVAIVGYGLQLLAVGGIDVDDFVVTFAIDFVSLSFDTGSDLAQLRILSFVLQLDPALPIHRWPWLCPWH